MSDQETALADPHVPERGGGGAGSVPTPSPSPSLATPQARARLSWPDLAQLVTAAAAVIGIFFTGFQLLALRSTFDRADRQNNLVAWTTLTQQEMALDDHFIEHPDLQKYFYEGARIGPRDPNLPVVQALATEMVDFFENVGDIYRYMPADRTTVAGMTIGPGESGMIDRATWEHYLVGTFRTSPAMCDVVRQRGDDYDSALRNVARRGCPIRRATEAPSPPTAAAATGQPDRR